MENILSTKATAGSATRITNNGGLTVIYEVRFGQHGAVEFVVLPGAGFTINAGTSDVDVNIKRVIDTPINVKPDA